MGLECKCHRSLIQYHVMDESILRCSREQLEPPLIRFQLYVLSEVPCFLTVVVHHNLIDGLLGSFRLSASGFVDGGEERAYLEEPVYRAVMLRVVIEVDGSSK